MQNHQDHRVYLHNHSPGLFDRAAESAKNGQGVASAMLAVASIEALPHDLVAWLKLLDDHSKTCLNNPKHRRLGHSAVCLSDIGHSLTGPERQLLHVLEKYDQRRSPFEKKLSAFRKVIVRKDWDPASPAFKNFKLLVAVRNAIVHPKAERLQRNLYIGRERGPLTWHPPIPIVDQLVQAGHIQRPDGKQSWLQALDTMEFGDWCLDAAGNFIHANLKLLPATPLCLRFNHEARLWS